MMRNYDIIKHGIFIGYREDNYVRLRFRTDRPGRNPTPKEQQMSPYKLHISLSSQDYTKHQTAITKMLLDNLSSQPGALKDFKLVNEDVIRSESQKSLALIEMLQQLQASEETDPEAEKKLQIALTDYYESPTDVPARTSIPAWIESLQEDIASRDRFLTGEQFTIYLPENYDEALFIDLCKKITRYLIKHQANPGTKSDVSSPIGPYFGLRQEYLLSDFESFNQTGFIASGKRIDSIPPMNSDAAMLKRRADVRLEQEASPLYKKLTSSLKKIAPQTLPAQFARLSFSESEGKGKEKKTEKTPPPSPGSSRKGS